MSKHDTSGYEELPYTNNAFASSHPMTLATVAALYGLAPPPLNGCRLLELGCGRGGNLLPMAESMPDSDFVGIDLSPRQIAEAQASRTALELDNVVFHARDIGGIDRTLGDFDYIVAHGVYSWVPRAVQEQLFRICAENLAQQGLAYVSYNTYPGWHYRGVVRDLLNQFVTRDIGEKDQVARARQLLEVVVNALPDPTGVRTKLVIDESQALMRQADGYVYHDHLEPENRPCYFHQFVTHAGDHGLKYVAEAQPTPLEEGVIPQARQAIQQLIGSDRLRSEQLIDFLVHRTFRRSILCRAECAPCDLIQAQSLRNCYAACCSRPAEDPRQSPPSSAVTFVTRSGDSMTTNHPLVKNTLTALHDARPEAFSFNDLARVVAGRTHRAIDESFKAELAGVLAATYRRGAVQLRLAPAQFCASVTDKPLASPVARLQARGDSRVTNREHRSIGLNPVDRLLLMYMDGHHDMEMLAAVVLRALRAGEIQAEGFDTAMNDRNQAAFVQRLIEQRASYLAQDAFLIG